MGTILPAYTGASKRPTGDDTPTSVYRYYDKLGILLYVGITRTGIARNVQHNRSAQWWPMVVRQEVEHLASRTAARAREKDLIQEYRPPFNVQHNVDHQSLRDAYLGLAVANVPADDIRAMLRRLNRTLPVTFVKREDGRYLRTLPEHLCVAQVLRMPASGPVRCGRGIHATSIQRVGPSALVRIPGKHGVLVTGGAITVRMTSQKPIEVTLRAVLLDFSAPKHSRPA